MILPIQTEQIPAATTLHLVARPQVVGIPRRLILDDTIARYASIRDVQVGKFSYAAAYGEVPGVAFHKDIPIPIALDMPPVEPGYDLTVVIFNKTPSTLHGSIAWELDTESEKVQAFELQRARRRAELAEAETPQYVRDQADAGARMANALETMTRRDPEWQHAHDMAIWHEALTLCNDVAAEDLGAGICVKRIDELIKQMEKNPPVVRPPHFVQGDADADLQAFFTEKLRED